MPGLINLHTHLEETALRSVAQGPDDSFASYIVKKSARLRQADAGSVRRAVRLAARELLASGTTTVVDSSQLGISPHVLHEEPIRTWIHHEVHAGSTEEQGRILDELPTRLSAPPGPSASIVGPYALFSLSPRNHRRMIQLAREYGSPWACHVAESAEELQAFSEQSGDLYSHITRHQEWPYRTNPTGSMYYAITDNVIPNNALCFHCNYVSGHELRLLVAKQVTVVVCSRYTSLLQHKPFPMELALGRGLRVCAATESPAEAPSLSLFDELYHLKQSYPRIPARQLISFVTQNPASALGMGSRLGSLTPGKHADIIGVQFEHDPNEDMLEELLVEEPKVSFVMVNGEEVVVGR
jgi:cytosine/adenosine deaminase-related metal-dependent hydrolase